MAAKPLHAGAMVERVKFQKRSMADDGAGNTVGDWTEQGQFCRPAGYIMKPGSEEFLASRLAGRQPATIFTYYDAQTSQVMANSQWRIVDQRDGAIYAIRAAEDMDRKRQWMTFVCEAGVEA